MSGIPGGIDYTADQDIVSRFQPEHIFITERSMQVFDLHRKPSLTDNFQVHVLFEF